MLYSKGPSYNIVSTLRGTREVNSTHNLVRLSPSDPVADAPLSLSGSRAIRNCLKQKHDKKRKEDILMWVPYETIRKHPPDFLVQYRFFIHLKKVVDEILFLKDMDKFLYRRSLKLGKLAQRRSN